MEYALILAGVAVALVAVLGGLQSTVGTAYRATSAEIAGVSTPSPGGGGGATSAAPAPTTTSPAPATTTAAPATTTAAPATTTAAPATTTAAPATTSAAPTPPAGSVPASPGSAAAPQTVPNWNNGVKDLVFSVSPAGAGTASLVSGKLVFIPAAGQPTGAVTVSWTFTKGGTAYSSSVTYWVS